MNNVPMIFSNRCQHPDAPYSPSSSQERHPWKTILRKIWGVVKVTLLVLAGCAMFTTNPTFFAMGVISGVIWDAKVQEIVNKVKAIWKSQPLSILLLTGLASFLALQVTWAAGSVLYAASLGSFLVRRAQAYYEANTI